MMKREDFDEFIARYNELQEEGYSYEDMCFLLMNNIDQLIEIAETYYDQHEN